MICPKCNTEAEGNFCPVCGTALIQGASPTKAEIATIAPHSQNVVSLFTFKLKSHKKFWILAIFAVAITFTLLLTFHLLEKKKYESYTMAMELLTQGELSEAQEILLSLSGYKDAAEQAGFLATYLEAQELVGQGSIEKAKVLFTQLGDYLDAQNQVKKLTSKIDGVSDGAYYRAVNLLETYDDTYWQECREYMKQVILEKFGSLEALNQATDAEIYPILGEIPLIQEQRIPLNAITDQTSGEDYALEQMVKLYWLAMTDSQFAKIYTGEDTSVTFQLIMILTDSDFSEPYLADGLRLAILEAGKTIDELDAWFSIMPNKDWI